MELFLDVDGVILDFELGFVDFVRQRYIPDLPAGYMPKTWEMENEFKDIDIQLAWDQFLNSAGFAKLDLLVDPISFNELTKKNTCYLITNIPQKYIKKRIQNLKLHHLKYAGLKLGGHFKFEVDYPDKSQVIAEIKSDHQRLIFLDDHPVNCRDVKKSFPTSEVFLMDRPHNIAAKDTGWTRVNNWADFLHKISL